MKQETEFKYPVIIFSDNEQRQNQNVKEQTRGMSAITVTHTSDDYNGRFGGEGGRGRRGRGKIVNAKNCFYSKSFFLNRCRSWLVFERPHKRKLVTSEIKCVGKCLWLPEETEWETSET